jgi:hypothetical protein
MFGFGKKKTTTSNIENNSLSNNLFDDAIKKGEKEALSDIQRIRESLVGKSDEEAMQIIEKELKKAENGKAFAEQKIMEHLEIDKQLEKWNSGLIDDKWYFDESEKFYQQFKNAYAKTYGESTLKTLENFNYQTRRNMRRYFTGKEIDEEMKNNFDNLGNEKKKIFEDYLDGRCLCYTWILGLNADDGINFIKMIDDLDLNTLTCMSMYYDKNLGEGFRKKFPKESDELLEAAKQTSMKFNRSENIVMKQYFTGKI